MGGENILPGDAGAGAVLVRSVGIEMASSEKLL